MRVQTEEWRRFIPGVRMYKGKMTLFYNGEKLWDGDGAFGQPLIYNEEERDSWEVIIVLPGVEVIPECTFGCCMNVKVVIVSDTVKRIEHHAFSCCRSLEFVKLSTNLEFIGGWVFKYCISLISIFIPPSCREIDNGAFYNCKKLIIFSVPQHIQLGADVIDGTALMAKCHHRNPNHWIKNLHTDNVFSLHHVCSSFNPLEEVISDIVKRQGLGAFKKQDKAGITASQYLSENSFTEIKEQQIVKRYMLDMMGEVDKGVNMNKETRKRPREDINDTEIGQAPKVMKQNTCIEEADNNIISSSTSQGLAIGVDLQPVLFRSKKESMWWPALATTSIQKLIFATKLDRKVKFQMLKMNRDAFKSNTHQDDKLIYISRFLFQHHPEDQQPMHIISKDQQHDLVCDFFDQSFVFENEEGPRGKAVNVAISWGCDSEDDTVGPMEHSGCVGNEALEEEKNECTKMSEDTRENLRRLEQENNDYKMKTEEQSKNIQQVEEENTFLKQKTEEQHSSIEKLTRLQDLSNGLKAELECPICFEPFDNPYLNPECAHRFCYRCIMKSISKSGKECPLCRVKISNKRVLRKDELIGSITDVVFRDDEIN